VTAGAGNVLFGQPSLVVPDRTPTGQKEFHMRNIKTSYLIIRNMGTLSILPSTIGSMTWLSLERNHRNVSTVGRVSFLLVPSKGMNVHVSIVEKPLLILVPF
jgi:hypothetical protein